jgi:hypothetical protein
MVQSVRVEEGDGCKSVGDDELLSLIDHEVIERSELVLHAPID